MDIHARIKNKTDEMNKFADRIMEELSKRPINWSQIYEYIMMIGRDITETFDIMYDVIKDTKERDRYISYIEEEDNKIKERIINKIKDVCKMT